MNNTQREIWQPIPGFEGFYEISNHGMVRGLDRTVVYKDGKVRHIDGKLLDGSVNPDGYTQFSLRRNGALTVVKAHQVCQQVFNGPIPSGHVVRHLNGDKRDNRSVNLTTGTPQDNINDSIRHGTHHVAFGDRTHCKRGHELVQENIMANKNNSGYNDRMCKPCHRERSRISAARSRMMRRLASQHNLVISA